MDRSNHMAHRRLPLAVAIMAATLLTWGATTLVPTSPDIVGWAVRLALFTGLVWAIR